MNRRVAKMIRRVAKITGRGYKTLKRSYYAAPDRDRYALKKEMKRILEDAPNDGQV